MSKNLNKFDTFSDHSYRTRGRFLLRPQFQRTAITQQSITYFVRKLEVLYLIL